MFVKMRLVRPLATVMCRMVSTSVTRGPTRLSRAHPLAATCVEKHNLQSQRMVTSKSENSQSNLLEKQVANLSADIHHRNRIFKNDLLRALSNVKENNFSSKWQGLLMLQCCIDMLPDEAPASRLALAEQVWNTLKPHTKFTVEHYNELLRCYIENGKSVNVANFIVQMSPLKPDDTTYELLLGMVCEKGDMNQAAEIVSKMKTLGIPATEKTFNSLIVGQGYNGNLKNIEEILTTMKTLKMNKTKHTHTAIAKAYLVNKDVEAALKELEEAQKNGVIFEDKQIMELFKCAAVLDLNDVLKKLLLFLPTKTLATPSISPHMQTICTQLVYLNRPLAALEIYQCLPLPAFGPSDDCGLHGRSLVRDCVKASLPSNVICIVSHELMTSGRNPIALQCACEAALQLGRVPLALDLLTRMKQKQLPLRPHYFWPILVVNSKSYGEKGALNTLSTMIQMEVTPDYETLFEFVLPFTSFNSPPNLMKKLLDCGLTVSEALTPMMHILVSSGQIRAASELCELFEGKIDAEKLIDPLVKGFLISEDAKSTVFILEDITKRSTLKHHDWVGRFVCKLAANKKIRQDRSSFQELMVTLKSSELKMSSSALEACLSQMSQQTNQNGLEEVKKDLESLTDDGLIDASEMFVQHIPHPRSMNTAELEAHLIELESNGMNTRGVLRKLLQKYCRENDLPAAKRVLDKCHQQQVDFSAGMKASIFDLHVKLGELELAEDALADLTKTFPNFVVDEFKLLGFATLLVYRNKINKAFDFIEKQSLKRRTIGGKEIEVNCWRLLDAIASTGTPKQTQNMLDLLTKHRYCRPSNVVLGPLIRAHLKKADAAALRARAAHKSEDLSSAVSEFVRVATKHHCTPLKHELLVKVLGAAGPDADVAASRFAGALLQADRRVHGAASAQLSLISALAELNYKKLLRRAMLDQRSRLDGAALLKRCHRFADEKKLAPIECIAECAREVRNIDRDAIYEIMLQVHQRSDDYQSALSLWYRMAEEDIRPPPKFASGLASLLKANNQSVPPEILAVLGNDIRKLML